MSANTREQYKANQLAQLEKKTTTGSPLSPTTSCYQMVTNTAKMPIEKVKQLIAAVSQRPSLWVRSWNNSQRRNEINRQWGEVSEETQLSVDVCRTKWGHLRDNFRKVFIRNSFTSQPPTTWRFYNDMRFMEKSVADNVIRQNQIKAQNMKRSYETSSPYIHSVTSQFDGGNALLEDDSFRKIRKTESNAEQQRRPYETQNYQHNLRHNYGHPATSPKRRNHSSSYASSMLEENNFDEDNIKVKLENDNSNAGIESQNNVIEVTDDEYDEEFNDSSSCDMQESENYKPANDIEPWKQQESTYPHIQVKQECSCNSVSNHADQMFLLSLLPSFQRISEERKLFVRQQLQQVLLDELP